MLYDWWYTVQNSHKHIVFNCEPFSPFTCELVNYKYRTCLCHANSHSMKNLIWNRQSIESLYVAVARMLASTATPPANTKPCSVTTGGAGARILRRGCPTQGLSTRTCISRCHASKVPIGHFSYLTITNIKATKGHAIEYNRKDMVWLTLDSFHQAMT